MVYICSPFTYSQCMHVVKESLFLLRNGVNIYSGGNLQAAPWLLTIFSGFDGILNNYFGLRILFIAADFGIAAALYRLSELLGKKQNQLTPVQVLKCYLYNPFGIIAVFGMNWTILLVFLKLAAMNSALQGNELIGAALCGFLIHVDFYNLALVAPIALATKNPKKVALKCLATWMILFITSNWLLSLYWGIRKVQFGEMLDSVYLSMMRVDSLRPNSGMFWYLYTQSFPAFTPLLKITFQMTLAVFWPACSIKFSSDPVFMFLALLGSQMILKPYPSVVDYAVYFGVLMTQFHIFERTRVLLVAFFVAFGVYVLKMQIWRYWIELPGFNANFYYIFTLIWNAILIIMYLDVIAAYTKHRIYRDNPKLEGKEYDKCKLFQR